ncbi:MAG: hypothetical protein J0H47_12645 [Gammaproteobacteria bacterium]|nr:hypothetical protein [Gammaproteobacteria bacterium]
MPTNKNVLTLPEFINLIKALELMGIVCQHQLRGRTNNEYIQLPQEVTIAFLKLDRSFNSADKHIYNSLTEFGNLMSRLVRFARFNNGNYPTSEKEHAEFLLGLLLHYNIHINFDSATYSIEDIMRNKLTVDERRRCHGNDMNSDDFYFCQFLSNSWRENQKYPTIEAVNNAWQKHLHQQEQARLESLRQQQEAEQLAALRQQYLAWKAYHHFEGTILNFEKFSYALEGFILHNFIQLTNEVSFVKKPQLPLSTTQLLLLFSNQARSPQAAFHQQELAQTFIKLMKEIIANAKTGDQACGVLLGFLLYHDFTLHYGNESFRISDIVKVEMTVQDLQRFQYFGENAFPFFSSKWQQAQTFPGRQEIEQVLASQSQIPQQHFLPGSFQGHLSRLNAESRNDLMQIEHNVRMKPY